MNAWPLDRQTEHVVKDWEGPLKEFEKLRDEIQLRDKNQHQLLALNLTIAGAVFGVAATKAGVGLLLVLPLIATTLCARFVSEARVVGLIARYVSEELSRRVPGGLGWESWLSGAKRGKRRTGRVLALICAFGGVSAIALVSCGHHVWTNHGFLGARVVAWFLGWAASLWCVGLIIWGEGDHRR